MSDAKRVDTSVVVVELVLEVQVPVRGWIQWLTQGSEIFKEVYCGQWLQSVAHEEARGWLVWVDDDGAPRTGGVLAMSAWANPAAPALPPGWYRLDEQAAVAAYLAGVKRWGVEWFGAPETDGHRYDQVVQIALLGKVVYA